MVVVLCVYEGKEGAVRIKNTQFSIPNEIVFLFCIVLLTVIKNNIVNN